jgi:hypothetical protein
MPVNVFGMTLLVLPAIVCVTSGCVDIAAGEARYVDTVEKRFTVTAPPVVRVSTFDGSVQVSTWDRQEVLVVIERHALDKAAADRMLVTAGQDGDTISVDVREQRDGAFHLDFGSFSARVTITVPPRTRLEASTGDGRVAVRDLEGDLNVRTGDGSIHLEHVTGAVDASSGDGSIDVDGAISRLRARSGDGRVRIHAVGRGPSADWNVTTGDGSVLLEVDEEFGAELDAATGDGRVNVQGLTFDDESDSRHRRSTARGRIGNGGGRVTIRTGDGSITVRKSDGLEGAQ